MIQQLWKCTNCLKEGLSVKEKKEHEEEIGPSMK